MIGRPGTVLLLLLSTAVVAAGASLLVGPVWALDPLLIREVRLPRVLLAILVGAGLAAAGAVFQGVLRNPLADPFILGTSSAAAAGVLLAGVLGVRSFPVLYAMALLFSLLSILLVFRIARTNGKIPVQTLILSGVIVGLFCNAAVFVFFSVYFRESFSVLFYLLGNLSEGDPRLIALSSGLILLGLGTSWFLSRELNLLTQGEETAFYLGIRVERIRTVLFAAASVMVAGSVAVAGMIGFVGLIVPHMMRMLIGPDHRVLIPASALGGGIFLILTDAVARTAAAPLEIPIGALTALLGSPYFVFLLRRRQRAGEF